MSKTSHSSADYEETLEYLYKSLPMFQRIGNDAFRKDLTNTRKLCEALGNPEKKFKSVHIAGTNGKGSSSHYLAAILQSSGYKTGLYTSPHLKSFTERIRINGKEVDKSFVIDFVQENKPLIETVRPSFFETTVAMAFSYFADQQVDIAVVEVGMGGRLDSTNVLFPEVSLITNIGFDHQQWLGDTLEKIAAEKAGIIKPGIPVVISEKQEQVAGVFTKAAERNGSELVFAEPAYKLEYNDPSGVIHRPDRDTIAFRSAGLPGYQEKNIPGVIAVCDVLVKHGFNVPDEIIIEGIESMKTLTGLKGRWQKLGSTPDVYCDVGHNEDGLKYVLKQIARIRYRKLFMIWGTVNDKDLSPMLEMLPKDAAYIFCQASIPRSLPAEKLQEEAAGFGITGEIIPDVNDAMAYALTKAEKSDLIVIGGSNFVVAEIEKL